MQRKLSNPAGILVTVAWLSVAACATQMQDAGDPRGGGAGTEAEGGTSGSAGAAVGGSAAGTTGGGMVTGGSASGTANGGVGGVPSAGGGGSGMGGATGGTSGGVAGSGGKASGGSGGTGGSGGRGGSGGTSGTAGASGSGGRGGSGGTSGTAGASGSGGTGGGTVNLITNSGFETNATGWSVFGGGGTVATTTAEAHSGTHSLIITGRTQTYQGPQYSVLSIATPGTSYSFTVWGKLAASNPTASLTVTLHYTCTGGSSPADNYLHWVDTTAASSSSWTSFSAVQTFPACAGGGTMGAAVFYVESPTATASYYIDDVVLSAP